MDEDREKLTARQLEIVELLSHGLGRHEIGKRLFLSPDTVKTHCQVIYRRLGAVNAAQAVATALRKGWIE